MPSCTPPCLLFRPWRNFSVYVGIFPTMFHFQGGIFPTMSEFFQIPILYAGKNPLLVDGRAPRSIWCKKMLWMAVKIFLLLLRDSSVMCKAISRKSAETFSFFLQCMKSIMHGAIRIRGQWIVNASFSLQVGQVPSILSILLAVAPRILSEITFYESNYLR